MANPWFSWPSSLTRFVRFDAARAEEVNNALDEVSTAFDGVETKTNAAIKLPDGETSAALGNAAARQNKVLTFDGSGNAVTTYAIADVATVSGIAADVTTVAGISGNVTTVANNDANVTTVAGSIANVNTVGTNIANVNAVAGNNANVTAVAGNATNINTVAGNTANINTVAGVSANVTTVATNVAAVNTTASNIAAIIDAPNQASAAAASANAAAASYDSFDDRYLGAKAADPTLDNDGNALITGALYWNSVAAQMRVYDGAAWQISYLPSGTYVAGPNSATDGNFAVFDGATGKVIKDGGSPSSKQNVMTVSVVTGTSQNAAANTHYVLTNASATTVTLPASPADGDIIWITVANSRTDNVVARNGKEIMGVAEDMTLDAQYSAIQIRYIDATRMWRIV